MNVRSILTRPIPDHTHARTAKSGYRDYPLLVVGSRDGEPLVDIAIYGIAGQSYYSRANSATGKPIPGIAPEIYVRQGIAEKLAQINYALQESADIYKIFGRKVELYVEEGYRSLELQATLYDEVFPVLIRKQQPGLTTAEVLARRDELSAKPPRMSVNGATPSPHATGAAIDVRLRYQHAELGYRPGEEVDMGHSDTSHLADPDYYEHLLRPAGRLSAQDKLARKHRRVFYWTMRGALLGDDTGFVVNPTEWWHWSYGDQLWAQLTNAPEAFYSFAEQPADNNRGD